MSTMKLQKLVYYAQAWSMAWDGVPLFPEHIEAWAFGPVVPALYAEHRGRYVLGPDEIGGNPGEVQGEAKETVDAVLDFYGEKSAYWLSEVSHKERPWAKARKGLEPGERGNREISLEIIQAYYSSL